MTKQEALELREQMEQEAEVQQVTLLRVTYRKRGWLVNFVENVTHGEFAVPSPDAWEDWKCRTCPI